MAEMKITNIRRKVATLLLLFISYTLTIAQSNPDSEELVKLWNILLLQNTMKHCSSFNDLTKHINSTIALKLISGCVITMNGTMRLQQNT